MDLKSTYICEKCNVNSIEYIYPLNVQQYLYNCHIKRIIELSIDIMFTQQTCRVCYNIYSVVQINEYCLFIYCGCGPCHVITTSQDHICGTDLDISPPLYSQYIDSFNNKIRSKPYYSKNSQKINGMLCPDSTIYSLGALLLCEECVMSYPSNQLTPILLNDVSLCSCNEDITIDCIKYISSEGYFCCDNCFPRDIPVYKLYNYDLTANIPFYKMRAFIYYDVNPMRTSRHEMTTG